MAAFSFDAKNQESTVAEAVTENGGSLWEAGRNWEDGEGERAVWKSGVWPVGGPPEPTADREASIPTPEAERGAVPEKSPKVEEPHADVERGS